MVWYGTVWYGRGGGGEGGEGEGVSESVTNKLPGAGVQTSYVHSSINK